MLHTGKKIIVFDGGFGSMLEELGLGGIPEELNITAPDKVRLIHRAYSCADVITTNTFGLNPIKYKGSYGLGELAKAACENARAAGKPVFFDVGPTGAMMEPMGELSFEDAYNAYKEVAEASRDIADGYILETFSDLYEIKAAILAFKENTELPIFATMTFDSSERTLTGSSPEIVANTLEGLGVNALGVNCSLGPKELMGVVGRLLGSTCLPVIVQPNRGLPTLENGKTVYKLTAEEFYESIREMVEMGVSAVGGCCGTTPELIKKISVFSGRDVSRPAVQPGTIVNSANCLCDISSVSICGERINPTGKKTLKQALSEENYGYIIDEALKQQEAGADILDVNCGLPSIDERAVMTRAVKSIQEYCDLPLQLDSTDPRALEAAARIYNGIPLINSVNGDEEVMAKIFPIAKKYGAVVLGLAMDKNGIPKTAGQRLEIAERIIKRAGDFGIPKHKIMIDTLVVTASAEQELAAQTLKALELVKGLGVKTALGISNISFGLPCRRLLNRTFLAMALERGLNMPIINPLDDDMTGTVRAFEVLSCYDRGAEKFIDQYKSVQMSPNIGRKNEGADLSLYDCIRQGLKTKAAGLCAEELKSREPMEIVEGTLIKALDEVGTLYEQGILFLPQLIASAEACRAAFSCITEALPKNSEIKGKVVLATVHGDVHDIGKNIVKVVIESYGWQVTDLGKDVSPQRIVDEVREHKPFAVGLSALMTTTVPAMEKTIAELKRADLRTEIFVGGAVLNEETARRIGADHYTKDALGMAKKLEELFRKQKA